MLYPIEDLLSKLKALFQSKGLDEEKSHSIAKILLEGELLGHKTHGLALVTNYIKELENGGMEKVGLPTIINASNSTELWDGRYLPGTWLTEKAIDRGIRMAEDQGLGTVVIQRSHHIACLAAYCEEIARQGLIVLIYSSDPRNRTVAPHGALKGAYSPNPIAMGIPSEGDPIILDVSTSTTANAVVAKAHNEGKKLGGHWLIKSNGQATNEPSSFFEEPASALLPLGGLDLGYKGFALGIMVEALTSALGGYGRSSNPSRWGASVMVQVIDPKKFAGESYFMHEMQALIDYCQGLEPINTNAPIRMPGQRGLLLKAKYLKEGIEIEENLEKMLNEI
jgi:LDH2 family malate/lactate/ureidoglycolate dehydrogenase